MVVGIGKEPFDLRKGLWGRRVADHSLTKGNGPGMSPNPFRNDGNHRRLNSLNSERTLHEPILGAPRWQENAKAGEPVLKHGKLVAPGNSDEWNNFLQRGVCLFSVRVRF